MWFVGNVRQHCPPKSSEKISSGSESGSAKEAAGAADGIGTDCGLKAGTPMGPLPATRMEFCHQSVLIRRIHHHNIRQFESTMSDFSAAATAAAILPPQNSAAHSPPSLGLGAAAAAVSRRTQHSSTERKGRRKERERVGERRYEAQEIPITLNINGIYFLLFYLRRSNAGLWIIIGCCCCSSCESSQESIYRPEKHGNIGN